MGEPTGKADVVGMKVGDEDAGDGPVAQMGEDLFPQVLGFGRMDAGVDDGPAFSVLDQPDVDVVELERQRHSDPMDAGRHFDGLAGFGFLRKRVFQAVAFARGRLLFHAVQSHRHLLSRFC